MGSTMTGFPRSHISLVGDLQRLLISQIESFYINGHTPNIEFDIFIFRSESLYIARAIVYEADQYGTIDTEFKTLMNGFSQEDVLGAFQSLWERLQIKFSPYLEEFVKVEKSVTLVKIMDKEADKHPEEVIDSVEEADIKIKSKGKKKVKAEDSSDGTNAESSDDAQARKRSKKMKKARLARKVGRLVPAEASSDDSESN